MGDAETLRMLLAIALTALVSLAGATAHFSRRMCRLNCPWLLKEQRVTETIERLRKANHDLANRVLVNMGEIERLKGEIAHLGILLTKTRRDA